MKTSTPTPAPLPLTDEELAGLAAHFHYAPSRADRERGERLLAEHAALREALREANEAYITLLAACDPPAAGVATPLCVLAKHVVATLKAAYQEAVRRANEGRERATAAECDAAELRAALRQAQAERDSARGSRDLAHEMNDMLRASLERVGAERDQAQAERDSARAALLSIRETVGAPRDADVVQSVQVLVRARESARDAYLRMRADLIAAREREARLVAAVLRLRDHRREYAMTFHRGEALNAFLDAVEAAEAATPTTTTDAEAPREGLTGGPLHHHTCPHCEHTGGWWVETTAGLPAKCRAHEAPTPEAEEADRDH